MGVAGLSRIAVIGAALGVQPAYGQAADADARTIAEDIVVTAQKRTERLQDVGLSVAVASGAQLQDANIVDVSGLAKLVPGFTAARSLASFPVYSIRGVGFNGDQISATPAVTVYVDEAPLPYGAMTAGALLDLERVEVLKGPQGTLFGQNATGGAINFIAAKPTDTLAAGLTATLNHFGEIHAEGFVSGPLADTLQVRLAASTTQGGAWQRSYTRDDRDGDARKGAARLLIDWQPADRLRISLNVNGFWDKSDSRHWRLRQPAPAGAAPLPDILSYPRPPKNNRYADWTPGLNYRSDTNFHQAALRLEAELSDDHQLTAITSHSRVRATHRDDLDSYAVNVGHSSAGGVAESFSQEVRLSGALAGGDIRYIVGGNYQHDDLADEYRADWEYSSAPILNNHYINMVGQGTVSILAGFANADINLAEKLTLTAGIRFTSTRHRSAICAQDNGDGRSAAMFGLLASLFGSTAAYLPGACVSIGPAPEFAPFQAHIKGSYHSVPWRVGLNYKLDQDLLLYALVSRGYKAGVYPIVTSFTSASFDSYIAQEKVTAYEIGAKATIPDLALTINAAAFYYQYDDKQLYTYLVDPFVGPIPVLRNIPDASVRGIDLDFTWRPAAGLRLIGGLAYIDSRVGDYPGFTALVQPVNFKGNAFSYTPEWQTSLDAEYRFPLGGVEMFAGTALRYHSRTYGDLAESPELRIPAYLLADARIGVEFGGQWKASVWANNITNKAYVTSAIVGADAIVEMAGMPRTFGASLGWRF